MGCVVKLVLGTLDVAYGGAHGRGDGATTTGDVAELLESRYHVMATFYDSRQDKIGEWLAGSVANAIETLVAAPKEAKPNLMPTADAEQKIEAEFRGFLDADEMTKMVAGLSESERSYFIGSTGGFSGAALAGVNHRKKHPFSKKNKARPAFVDTGLYRQSFRAVIEE